MTPAEKFFKDMQEYPHILTYREITQALVRGAIAGEKTGFPGGAVGGAAAGLCIEAGVKVVAITKDLLKLSDNSNNLPSSKPS